MNDIQLKNAEYLAAIIHKGRNLKHKHALVQVSPVENINTHVDSTSPQIALDQMVVMAHQHHADIKKHY